MSTSKSPRNPNLGEFYFSPLSEPAIITQGDITSPHNDRSFTVEDRGYYYLIN
jgi:hypothetical protein